MQPEWFSQSIAVQPVSRTVTVSGTVIHYLHWPAPGRPGLLLVHGHAAHAHWWDFIAPAFTDRFDVVAIDLSGAGDSGHREAYSATQFAGEIVAVSEAAGLNAPTVVGHSFGGTLTRVAAHLFPASMQSIVIVDSVIPDRRGSRTPPSLPKARERIYPTLADGMKRFRLRPPQPRPADYILDHIARHSLKQVEGGFTFKLDQAVFAKMPADEGFPVASDMVSGLAVPVGFIYGERSRFFPAGHVKALTACIDPALVQPVADAYHHVFLDQPLAFIEALSSLLEKIRPPA